MKKFYPIIILIFSLFIGCSDNPSDVDNGVFNVEVHVVDSDGNPLPDINVGIWSKINYSNSMYKISSPEDITAASTVSYALPEECFVELTSFDLNDNIKEKIVTGRYPAGYFYVTLQTNENVGTGVYKIKLITSSDSLKNSILFQDSIYIVLWQPDPAYSSIGKTNNSGTLETSNKLLFPHLTSLPLIPHTGLEGPEVIDYLSFSDSVTIALSDGNFSQTRYFVRSIKNGPNKIFLNWNEGTQNSNHKKPLGSNNSIISKVKSNLMNIPADWRLDQNYPNPFN